MLEAIAIFCAQFVMILTHGLQSQTVAHGHKLWAACNSLILGCLGYYLTSSIAAQRGNGWHVFVAFILAGPCGIVTSIVIFRRFKQ
jgi:hypothetical protein